MTFADVKKIKFIFDDNCRERPSYAVTLSDGKEVFISNEDYRRDWDEWVQQEWRIQIDYVGVDRKRWQTVALKKNGEFVIQTMDINPLPD